MIISLRQFYECLRWRCDAQGILIKQQWSDLPDPKDVRLAKCHCHVRIEIFSLRNTYFSENAVVNTSAIAE